MKRLLILFTLIFSSSNLSAKDVSFHFENIDLQGVPYKFGLPKDHCFYSKEDNFERAFSELLSGLNKAHATNILVYANCTASNNVKAGKTEDLYPFGFISQAHHIKSVDLTGKEAKFTQLVCSKIGKMNPSKYQEIQKNNAKKLQALDKSLKISWKGGIKMIEVSSRHCIFAQKSVVEKSGVKDMILTLGMVLVADGKMLTSHYADVYKDKADLARMIAFLKAVRINKM